MTAADIVDRIRRGDNLKQANLRYVALERIELTDGDFEGADLEGAILDRIVFRRCNLRGANFSRTTLGAAHFVECDLDRAALSGARGTVHFERCQLRQARLDEVDFERARFEACQLDEASLDGALLPESTWYRVSATHASFVRADLEMAVMRQVDLTGAAMARANLSRSALDQVTFDQADLSHSSGMFANVGAVSLASVRAQSARWWWLYNADPLAVTRLRAAGAHVSRPVNLRDPLWKVSLRMRDWFSSPLHVERSPVVSRPLVTRGSLLMLSIALVVVAAVAAVVMWRGGTLLADRIRYNHGIPVSNSALMRLDDQSFMFMERGWINVLTWNGTELTLSKRYRIDYDESQNLYYLDEAMKKAVLRDAKP